MEGKERGTEADLNSGELVRVLFSGLFLILFSLFLTLGDGLMVMIALADCPAIHITSISI